MTAFFRRKNSFLLAAALFLVPPVHSAIRNETSQRPAAAPSQPKPRRYKIGEAPEDKMSTPLERFLINVGTLGLIYFWPGARFQLKSSNANIEISGPRR
jgi:hypothetical protein